MIIGTSITCSVSSIRMCSTSRCKIRSCAPLNTTGGSGTSRICAGTKLSMICSTKRRRSLSRGPATSGRGAGRPPPGSTSYNLQSTGPLAALGFCLRRASFAASALSVFCAAGRSTSHQPPPCRSCGGRLRTGPSRRSAAHVSTMSPGVAVFAAMRSRDRHAASCQPLGLTTSSPRKSNTNLVELLLLLLIHTGMCARAPFPPAPAARNNTGVGPPRAATAQEDPTVAVAGGWRERGEVGGKRRTKECGWRRVWRREEEGNSTGHTCEPTQHPRTRSTWHSQSCGQCCCVSLLLCVAWCVWLFFHIKKVYVHTTHVRLNHSQTTTYMVI